MLRKNIRGRALLLLGAALALAGVLVAILAGGGEPSASTAATPTTTPALQSAPAALARYREGFPHVTSQLNTYAVQGTVQGAPSTPPDELPPVSASAFRAPVASYRAYSVRRLKLMAGQVTALSSALAAGDRDAAQTAWRGAYAYYLNLGAVYLEGPVGSLNDAIDGGPGGLPGGVASPRFSGLHRLERGLWSDAPLASLKPWARRLTADVARLAKLVAHVGIDPADYATRAHEILEDAVRDQLSGTDAPWSGAGVLGTSAGVVATTKVIKTLAPILSTRESVLPTVNADLADLRSVLAAIARADGGALPTTSELTQAQSERLDASLGQALEGLAQVPGALETTRAPAIPQIPAKEARSAR
jgi:iron uptake system EfeUOB component EfeO/EfeM